MYQALDIVILVFLVLDIIVIGLFCLSVIEEERSKTRFGGGKESSREGMSDDEAHNDKRKDR